MWKETETLSPGPGRVRGAKGKCPSIHGPKAKVDLGAPAGIGDLRQGWEVGVRVNKYTVTATPKRSLYSATQSSELQPWSHLLAPLALGKCAQAKAAPRA